MALKQGFGNGRGQAKVRVRLIVASVMQVIAEGSAHEASEPLLDFFAALQAGPHAGIPGGDPTATDLARLHPSIDRPGQFRTATQRDGAAGKDREVRRNVV